MLVIDLIHWENRQHNEKRLLWGISGQDFTLFLYLSFLTNDIWWWTMANSVHSCWMFWIHFSSGHFPNLNLVFDDISRFWMKKVNYRNIFPFKNANFVRFWICKSILKLVPSWDLKRKSFKTPTQSKWFRWVIFLFDIPPKRAILRIFLVRFHFWEIQNFEIFEKKFWKQKQIVNWSVFILAYKLSAVYKCSSTGLVPVW